MSGDAVARTGSETLAALPREMLEALCLASAKNLIAIDGTWFQSVERECGMDAAMHHDVEAWRRYTASEARRLAVMLDLGENPGLAGLARALPLKLTSLANRTELSWTEDGALVFRVVECRVQAARARKGMPYHPCKPAGVAEYEGFARALDPRISCECVSCFPDVSDETCACAWKFTIGE